MNYGEQFLDLKSEKLAQLMSEFESEINSMEATLAEVDEKTKDVSSIWDGEDSEKVMIPFNNFKKEFSEINIKNKEYLKFLQYVIDKYKDYDKNVSNTVDDNVKAFDFVDN